MSHTFPHHPNIILIVIDALRARSLSCYGGEEGISPNIDSLARRGILFEDTYSTWNTTDQSLTTILSGRYPRTHGIVHFGPRVTPEDLSIFEQLEIKLLSQILRQNGYTTLAIDWMSRWFKEGFDYYGYEPERDLLHKVGYYGIKLPFLHLRYLIDNIGILRVYTKKKKISFKKAIESVGNFYKTFRFSFELARIHDAYFIRKRAEELIRNHEKENFFLFLHLWDTHSPYNCPRKFLKIKKKGLSTKEYLVEKYKGSIRYVDRQLGRFFKMLDERGLMDEVLIIITSDHGESLTEHEIYFDHHGLYDETTHVPLIFYSPEFFPEAKRVKGFIQHVDILPTLCELLGIDHDEYSFDGKSLLPLINGETDGIRPYIYTEESFAQRKVAVRDESYKYICAPESTGVCNYCHKVHGGLEELYDLDKDPREKKNVASKHRAKSREMKGKLMDFMRSLNTKREKQLISREVLSFFEEGEFPEETISDDRGESTKRARVEGGRMKRKKVFLELPEEVIDEIEKRVRNSEFKTVENYLSYIVLKVFHRRRKKEKLNRKEDAKIKKKLQSLGYMD